MKIEIPHLAYTIYIKQPKEDPRVPGAVAWVESLSPNHCVMHIKHPMKPHQVPTLAHELVHVLQYIARDRNISFVDEAEHFAYLMQWLMNKVLGYSYYE